MSETEQDYIAANEVSAIEDEPQRDIEKLYAATRALMDADRRKAFAEIDEHADPDGCGGTWTTAGPPCGTCVDCARARWWHYAPSFEEYVQRAREAGGG